VAIKLSVINFKGGVGKTTLAFHLSTHLGAKFRVLVVDVDHQSSLSIVMLGGRLWEGAQKAAQTSNRIFEAFCNPRVKAPGHEIVVKNPFHARQPKYNFYPTLDLVPAQFELDDTEIEMASTTFGGPMVSEWRKRALMAEWLDSIDADTSYDFIVFDCPPATKLVSQNAITASDYYLIPVIPDELSSRGVTHFRNLVSEKVDKKIEAFRLHANVGKSETPRNYVANTKLAGIVPFMAKSAGRAVSGLTNLHTRHIAELRRMWKGDVLNSVIKHLTAVPESMDAGWPVWNRVGYPNVTPPRSKMLRDLCSEIELRITPQPASKKGATP
jgi:chromosome partitioning protein